MAKYNVFETTNMGAVHYAERIFDAVATEDIENGTFGYLDGLAEGESVIYKFVKGIKSGAFVVVANNPAWDFDTSNKTNQRRDKFVIKAGTPFRAYVVKVNDEFATAVEGVTAATQEKMKAGAYVTIDATTGKLVADEATNSGAVMEGVVMRERIVGGTVATATNNYGYTTKMYEVRVTTLAD